MDKNKDWEAVVGDWEASGLSQSEYCRRSGIVESRFSYWKRKLADKVASESKFVAVTSEISCIELSVGKVNLKLPLEIKPERVAELVKCLN